MENINWLASLIIGALIAIPIGLFVNLITPNVQDWRSKYSVKIRGNNIENLENQIRELEYHKERNTFYIPIFSNVIFATIFFMLGVLGGVTGIYIATTGGRSFYSDSSFILGFGCIVISLIISFVTIVQLYRKYESVDYFIQLLRDRISRLKGQ